MTLAYRHMQMTLARREQDGGLGLSPEAEKQIKIDVTSQQRNTFLRNARWAKEHGLTKDMQIYVRMACRFHRRLQELKAQS
jgi:hypothetical protein